MAHLTQSGRLRGQFLFLLLYTCCIAYPQSSQMTCTASAVPTIVRAEGVAERMGDILLQCSGGTAGTVVSGNLSVFLPVSITNRLNPDSMAAGAALTVETGAAPAAAFSGLTANQNISFNGVQFTIPVSRATSLRVSGLRANVNQLGAEAGQNIAAQIATSIGSLALTGSSLVVARTERGLLATTVRSGIPALRAPVPAEISLPALFEAGTPYVSARFTEGFAEAFQPADASTTNGTRIVVRYTGVPAGTRLFVPDVVAGSDAPTPTAGGDLGGQPSGGAWTPGNGTLLLSRVQNTDAEGAGGVLVFTPGAEAVAFQQAGEIAVASGSGMVVYEVVDASPARSQSAQFPTFVAGTAHNGGFIRQAVSFGPISTALAASATAPVPRFAAVEPAADCPALGDCGSEYFPRLEVFADGLALTVPAGTNSASRSGYIAVRNAAGGFLVWNSQVVYKNGSGWLTLTPDSGLNNGSVRLFPSARNLAEGKYEAEIVIDAGPLAGSVRLPVTLTVTAAPVVPPVEPPPPARPAVTVNSFTNAANFLFSPVAPGSLATIMGANLAGTGVSVTFDGLPARVIFNSATQINLQVPAGLAGKTSASMVVTVDGVSSAPAAVALAASAPAIFSNGILNQDNSVNGPARPAVPGSVIQIWVTGMPSPGVSVKIHDRDNLVPQYAGAAPGLEGVQQVNVAVPADLPAMTTDVLVCAAGACSHPARVTLGR